MIAKDLSEKQASDVDPKAIKQINFTGYLSGKNNRLMFLLAIILDYSQGTVKVLKFYFLLI